MTTNGQHAAVDDVYDVDDLFKVCLAHLTGTHAQLWGRAFNISDPNQRRIAAGWLADQIVAVAMIDAS